MPSPVNRRRGGPAKKSKARLSEKAYSFHERDGGGIATTAMVLPRPRTVPDLSIGRRFGRRSAETTPLPRQTKLLLNVTVQRSLGAVRVVMPMEATVEDLIAAALRQYAKEERVPALSSTGASGFRLHYSQFSLESLDSKEKLVALGSRNFFMCPPPSPSPAAGEYGGDDAAANEDVEKGIPCLKFMGLLL